MDRDAGGREIARGRELQGLAVIERHHGLHRALAESALTEELGAPVVAQRPGDDLGGGSGTLVNKHGDRRTKREVARHRLHAEARLLRAAFRRDDDAFLEERVRDFDRGIQDAARIVAQVEHETTQPACGLLLERANRGLGVCPGRFAELRDAQITVAGLEYLVAHGMNGDQCALNRELERLRGRFTADGELDDRAGLAANGCDRVGEAIGPGRTAVDLEDRIARMDPRPRGWRTVDRGDDLEHVGIERDLDADAGVIALGRDPEVLEFLRVHEGRVRVELADHAADRVRHQLVVVGPVDIVLVDQAEDLGEQAFVVRRDVRGVAVVARVPEGAGGEHDAHETAQQADQ